MMMNDARLVSRDNKATREVVEREEVTITSDGNQYSLYDDDVDVIGN